MKNLMMIAALATAMFTTTESDAQHAYRKAHSKIQHAQVARINQGVRNGSLNQYEARHLRLQQARLRQVHRRAMADGVITRRERYVIRAAEARNSRAIYTQKHDRQFRRY